MTLLLNEPSSRLWRKWLVVLQGLVTVAVAPTLRAQGDRIDPGFIPATQPRDSIQALALTPEGAVLAAGTLGSGNSTRSLIRLTSSGALDPLFTHLPGWGHVKAIARQPDGRIVIAGSHGPVLGVLVARLNADGSVDTSFAPGDGVGGNMVSAIALQTNGQIVLGGPFFRVGGVSRRGVARLNAHGSLDTGFDPGTGAEFGVETVAVQPDGKILVGGWFTTFSGVGRPGLARLNPNGSFDNGFVPALSAGASVRALVVQPDGKCLVGGTVPVAGVNRGVVRLNRNGSLDASFDPGAGLAGQSNAVVAALALQPDGKILVGGAFARFSGVPADNLVRLHPDGSLEVGYDPGTFHEWGGVWTLALHPDGAAVAGGSFLRVGGLERSGLVRLRDETTSGYAGRIQFSDARYSLSETGGLAPVSLLRTRSTEGPATVNYTVSNGSGTGWNDTGATAGQDFVAQSGTLTFTNGQTSAEFAVEILDDTLGEVSENVALTLSPTGGGAAVGQPADAMLTIPDNDSAFDIWFWPPERLVREDQGMVELLVYRQGVRDGIATVDYSTVPGTAMPGSDFTPQSGTLTFNSGDGFMRISVPILEDDLTEGAETFSVQLSHPSPGSHLNPQSQLVVTITDNDDDGPGSIKPEFAPKFLASSYSATVEQVALGPEGDLFVAGTFTNVNGVSRNRLARLNGDGSLDERFHPEGLLFSSLTAMAVDPEGRMVLAGYVMDTNTNPHPFLWRLREDGSNDPDFDAGEIAGGTVRALARDATGRWLLGGDFLEIGGTNRTGLARVAADGRLDPGFQPALGPLPSGVMTPPLVWFLAVQADRKVLIAGFFNEVNRVSQPGFARLNPDGSLDESFDPSAAAGFGVAGLTLQPDGKMLVRWSAPPGVALPGNGLQRLNEDGSVDATFAFVGVSPSSGPGVSSSGLSHVAVLPDGRIMVAGGFTLVDGLPRRRVARLERDGSLDPSFDIGAVLDEMEVWALAVEPTGDVILGGRFTFEDIFEQRSLLRLRGDNPDFMGRFELGASAVRVWETNGLASITLHRFGGAPGPASVHLVAASGTASNGVDFVLGPTIVEFAEGETRRTIEFAVVRDALVEPPENLTLTLSDPVGAILGSQIRATLTILDHPGGLVDETFHASLASSTNWDDGWSYTAFSSPARSGDGRVYSCASLGQGPLRRFLLNGAADPTFQPAISACPSAMVVQSDGKLLLSWKANVTVPPVVSNRIARLNLDGSMDASFHPDLGVDGTVGLLVLQANGEILVGGTFGSIGGIAQSNLARLHVDGSVDPSFAPVVPSNTLHQILLQPDGRILLGGTFTAINGFTRQGVARLMADGTLDPEFQPPLRHDVSVTVLLMALQGDGKILLGGPYLSLEGRRPGGILRLTSTGAPDPTFDPEFGIGESVRSLFLQADGKVIVGLYDSRASRLVRLLNDDGAGAGRIEFATPTVSVSENSPSVTLTVRRAVSSRGAIRVGYGVSSARARAGEDFLVTSGIVQFEDGDTMEKTITVPLRDDSLAEGTEDFLVHLSNPIGGATFGAPAVVTLVDDDTELEFVETTLTGREEDLLLWGQVRRVGSFNGVVTVQISTRDDTAVSGRDYLPHNCTVTFGEGQTNQAFAIPILEDPEAEADETFDLALSHPGGGARLGTNATARATIADNDRPGTVDTEFRTVLTPFTFDCEECGGQHYTLMNIRAIVLQPDGRILVGGIFSDPTGTNAVGLVRLMPDGALDWSFAPGGASNGLSMIRFASQVALQPDGRVLVAFGNYPATIVRLHEDGWLDDSFQVATANSDVSALVLQPNGQILLSGAFTTVNGSPRSGLARLNDDGSLDATFAHEGGAMLVWDDTEPMPGVVTALALQADGKILIGGRFNTVNGVARNGLARLTGAGAVDAGFGSGSGLTNHYGRPGEAEVSALAVEPDGDVLVLGCFGGVNGLDRTNLVRLHADGAVDAGFNPPPLGCMAWGRDPIFGGSALALQRDGRILIAGAVCGAAACTNVLRLNPDGSLDETFDGMLTSPFPSEFRPLSGEAIALGLQPDGQILVGRSFFSAGGWFQPGSPEPALVRLNGGVFRFEFRSLSRLAGGRARLAFAMPRGQNYLLQASRNLVHWTDLNPGQPLQNQSEFVDPGAAGEAQRFYRARRIEE